MKKTLTFLLLFLTSLANAQIGLLNGTGYAPDITVTDINGNTHNLYNYLDSGKVVVLELMSVTCGHCQSHAAGTENSYQTNGPSGTDVARFLGLEINSSTDSAAVANFANTFGVTSPIANNVSPTAINYQLYYTPGYYVIYPDRSYTTICALYCVTAQNYSTIEGLLNTAIAAWVPPIYGCTDSLAINYNPLANITNDSCDYTSYTITTVGMSFSTDTIICDVGDTINFILGGYHNAVEVSDSTWLANGNTSNGGFSFAYGATGMFIPDDCHTFYYVCQPHALSGMKGVIIAHHPPVFGCADSLALNYDSLATVDDGSCTYPCLSNEVSLNLFDFYGDGWSGAIMTVNGIDYTLFSGAVDSFDLCIDMSGCTALIYTPGSFFANIENSWNVTDASGAILAAGPDASGQLGNGCAVYGCTDSTATNYNPLATTDDGSCIVYGCTDPLAFNYDSLANTDDNSCVPYLYGCTDSLAFNFNQLSINNDTIFYDDFSNLQNWTLTNSSIPSLDWSWTNNPDIEGLNYSFQGDSAWNSISPFLSTTVNNGFMFISSDAVPGNYDQNGTPVIASFTNTNTIDLTNYLSVNLEFEHNYWWWQDTRAVRVSGDGGTTWTQFDITDANGYPNNQMSGNPEVTTIDISSIAGGMSEVLVQFYYNDNDYWGWYWAIDDVRIISTDSNLYYPNTDDGSCYYTTCGGVTGVNLTDIIQDRATFNWDNMNSSSCQVDQIRFRYREVGTNSWSTKTMGVPVGSGCNTSNTSKLVLGLTANTTYEYDFKLWYCNAATVNWHANGTFTTADACVNATNMIATTNSTTQANFCWDAPASPWSFVRLQFRENVPGSSFSNIGGFGVMSPAVCKTKNGLAAGTEYRVIWRTWCSVTGGPYRSPVWDGPVIWTQPTSVRLEGTESIANLAIYPNPSRDLFNISFTSDDVQDLRVRILNLIGEELVNEDLQQFIGEYTKQIDLTNNAKGIYFLEIETNEGVINKKLILQ